MLGLKDNEMAPLALLAFVSILFVNLLAVTEVFSLFKRIVRKEAILTTSGSANGLWAIFVGVTIAFDLAIVLYR